MGSLVILFFWKNSLKPFLLFHFCPMTEEFKINFLKSSGNDFFNLLDQHLKATIPPLIKKNLMLSEYNCAIVLAKFDDASISSIEDNVKNNLDAEMLLEGETLKDYLGRFSKCQQKFKFMDGHRKCFSIIAETWRMFLGKTAPSEPTPPSEARGN